LVVYTTAVRAAGATKDVMTAYLPIVLGQDALQWLRHLPRHYIDDWSDFSRCFIANFQSLSDKPAQPWDLKSIRRGVDETLRSYLKRFQTMRNRILEVAEAAVIEDFYRGSNDSAFVRAILQKAPTTSEQLFREADLYITPTNGLRTSLGERSLLHLHHGVTQTSRPTSARRRGLVKRSMLLDHPSLVPEVHPAKASRHWTTSSMPSACITRICATPCGTAETSSIPSGMADRSNLYHLPHREEGPVNLDDLSSRKREEVEHFRTSTERSTSSSEDMVHKKTKGNRSSTTDRYWWPPPVPPPPIDGQNTRSPLPGWINGSTSIIRESTRSSSIQ
jgi:hypothetical protein